MTCAFNFFQGIKTATRDLEQSAREILAVLQAVHQSPNPEGMFLIILLLKEPSTVFASIA